MQIDLNNSWFLNVIHTYHAMQIIDQLNDYHFSLWCLWDDVLNFGLFIYVMTVIMFIVWINQSLTLIHSYYPNRHQIKNRHDFIADR